MNKSFVAAIPVCRNLLALAAMSGMALVADVARAQPSKPAGSPTQPSKGGPPASTPTSTPATPGSPPGPTKIVVATTKPPTEPGPFLKASNLSGWRLRSIVQLTQSSEVRSEKGETANIKVNFPFETMSVVYPVVPVCANSVSEELKSTVKFYLNTYERISGQLVVGKSVPLPNGIIRPELLRTQIDGSPYHSGTHLIKMALGEPGKPSTISELKFEVEVPMTCWDTDMEEELAAKVGWPKNGWPLIAATTFEAQLFVDAGPRVQNGPVEKYDVKVFDDLLTKWLNGGEPTKMPPVRLAKFILSNLLPPFKIEGFGTNLRQETTSGAVHLQGLRINGAERAARQMQGTEWDLVCVTAALFRHAGIPTRTVIGYDIREQEQKVTGATGALDTLPRAWVEIYLYDEVKNVANWIPVDPVRMRKASNRTPRLEDRWQWFGWHDEMRSMLPLGFQFHPPTSVRAYGSAALWGWLVTPVEPIEAGQSLTFVSIKSSIVDKSVKGVPQLKYNNDPRSTPRK